MATEGDEETRREAFQAVYRRLEVRLRRFLEPARAPTSAAAPQRPMAWTAEANAVETPPIGTIAWAGTLLPWFDF